MRHGNRINQGGRKQFDFMNEQGQTLDDDYRMEGGNRIKLKMMIRRRERSIKL
jgi:hypothetical protein